MPAQRTDKTVSTDTPLLTNMQGDRSPAILAYGTTHGSRQTMARTDVPVRSGTPVRQGQPPESSQVDRAAHRRSRGGDGVHAAPDPNARVQGRTGRHTDR